MRTELVGPGPNEPSNNCYNNAYDPTLYSSQNRFHFSGQDDQDLAHNIPSPKSYYSSSPPPELPTCDTVPFSDRPDILGPSFDSGYKLRPGPRLEGKLFHSTWLDQDATATYDPRGKHDPYLRPPIEIFEGRKRVRVDLSDLEPNKTKVPRIITWHRGRTVGNRLPVTFLITSRIGKLALAEYGSALDNWPKTAYRPPNEEIDWASWWNPGLTFIKEKSSRFSHEEYHRARVSKYLHNSDDCGLLRLEDVTLGHPSYRGCKGCFTLGQRCPLLDEGSRYPCEVCVEDDMDCELISEPAEKGACLNCGRKRISCSYREVGSDHRHPCSHCSSKGVQCIAGPASGRTRTGPAIDSALHHSGGSNLARSFASCTQCRKAKKWCSLIKNKSATKCNECIKNNDSCTFAAVQRKYARNKCVKEILNQAPNLRLLTATNTTQRIKTRLVHPIEFNYPGDRPCHWCEDQGYGLLGLEEVEVEVIDFNDGNGYIELSGGHFEAGHEASRMCDNCTLDRLAIAACSDHNVKPIEGMDFAVFDAECVMKFLLPGLAASAPFDWCAVCLNPASYTCCKEMGLGDAAMSGLKGIEQKQGCGLKLCNQCAETLMTEKGGNLEALVVELRDQDEGVGLRADVDFLLPAGELVRRFQDR